MRHVVCISRKNLHHDVRHEETQICVHQGTRLGQDASRAEIEVCLTCRFYPSNPDKMQGFADMKFYPTSTTTAHSLSILTPYLVRERRQKS